MTCKSGIYKITNLINNHCYIGSAVDLKRRKIEHFSGSHSSPYLQNSMNKYDKKNFKFEVLEYVKDKELLLKVEQYFIDNLKPEYNLRKIAKSNLGMKYSEEHKQKISNAHKGKVLSENHRQKLSEAKKGERHPCYGKQRSLETKQRISESTKGRIIPLEHKEKLRQLHLGSKLSKEHKQKISNSLKGHIGTINYKPTNEIKQKISNGLRKYWSEKRKEIYGFS